MRIREADAMQARLADERRSLISMVQEMRMQVARLEREILQLRMVDQARLGEVTVDEQDLFSKLQTISRHF